MITIRKAADRGHADHGWLRAAHTFSFADYHDPAHHHFSSLRVINEDRVAGGAGFSTHGHRDMEIITYIISGELAHKDSMGNAATIRRDEVQRMSAGTGVEHSEFNPLPNTETHLLQIWLVPDRKGHAPSYEQKSFAAEFARGGLTLVASSNGRSGSVTIHQDADLYVGRFAAGARAAQTLAAGRHAWVQVVSGSLSVNGVALSDGDGAAVSEEESLDLRAESACEFLLFDLT